MGDRIRDLGAGLARTSQAQHLRGKRWRISPSPCHWGRHEDGPGSLASTGPKRCIASWGLSCRIGQAHGFSSWMGGRQGVGECKQQRWSVLVLLLPEQVLQGSFQHCWDSHWVGSHHHPYQHPQAACQQGPEDGEQGGWLQGLHCREGHLSSLRRGCNDGVL